VNIKQAIRKALYNVEGYAMPQSTLAIDVRAIMGKPPTHTELEEALSDLEARHQVTSVRDPDDAKIIKWSITTHGIAAMNS
jgi:hypothetical protein